MPHKAQLADTCLLATRPHAVGGRWDRGCAVCLGLHRSGGHATPAHLTQTGAARGGPPAQQCAWLRPLPSGSCCLC